jgi:hypothetical protein
VNLAQHVDRLLRLAGSFGEPLVHCVIFSVRRAAETRPSTSWPAPVDRSRVWGVEAVRELGRFAANSSLGPPTVFRS